MSSDHTWEINIHYHECPNCGFIIENRAGYYYDKTTKQYMKEIECPRCAYQFQEVKKAHKGWKQLFGKTQPASIEWNENRKNR